LSENSIEWWRFAQPRLVVTKWLCAAPAEVWTGKETENNNESILQYTTASSAESHNTEVCVRQPMANN